MKSLFLYTLEEMTTNKTVEQYKLPRTIPHNDLPASASVRAGITGMCHHHPADSEILKGILPNAFLYHEESIYKHELCLY